MNKAKIKVVKARTCFYWPTSIQNFQVHVTTQKIVSAVFQSTQGMILLTVNLRSSLGRRGHNFQFENQCLTQLKVKVTFQVHKYSYIIDKILLDNTLT